MLALLDESVHSTYFEIDMQRGEIMKICHCRIILVLLTEFCCILIAKTILSQTNRTLNLL